jgi:hypothetical protein
MVAIADHHKLLCTSPYTWRVDKIVAGTMFYADKIVAGNPSMRFLIFYQLPFGIYSNNQPLQLYYGGMALLPQI